MSHENVEFLRQGYEALHRGDLETFMALSRERLDPEVVFYSVWDGRVFKGLQGAREWISDTREVWDNYDQKVEEIVDLGANVVVVVRIAAVGGAAASRGPETVRRCLACVRRRFAGPSLSGQTHRP